VPKSVEERRKELLFLTGRMIELRFYGVLTDLAGNITEKLDISAEITFADLKKHLEKKYPDLHLYSVVFFQNNKFCAMADKVTEEVEIDCMPPFSGG
jgi:molybdopterin converting factor small subunit